MRCKSERNALYPVPGPRRAPLRRGARPSEPLDLSGSAALVGGDGGERRRAEGEADGAVVGGGAGEAPLSTTGGARLRRLNLGPPRVRCECGARTARPRRLARPPPWRPVHVGARPPRPGPFAGRGRNPPRSESGGAWGFGAGGPPTLETGSEGVNPETVGIP